MINKKQKKKLRQNNKFLKKKCKILKYLNMKNMNKKSIHKYHYNQKSI